MTVVLHDDGGTASGGVDASAAQTFTIDITKTHPDHNAVMAEDASGDGSVAPGDALDVINFINKYGSLKSWQVPEGESPYMDVNHNTFIDPDDSLEVINYVNSHPATPPPPAGEGEPAAPAVVRASDVAAASIANTSALDTSDELANLIAQLAIDAAQQALRRRQRLA